MDLKRVRFQHTLYEGYTCQQVLEALANNFGMSDILRALADHEKPAQPQDPQGDVWCVVCKWSGHHSELIEGFEDDTGPMGPMYCPKCQSNKISAVVQDVKGIPF